jgi:polyferredoxin
MVEAMGTQAHTSEVPLQKKKLIRRLQRDRSQVIRRGVQVAFLALNVWIGFQFYGFVRYCESGGATPRFSRPAGVEGWLPIASLMNLKYLVITGRFPQALGAGMLLLISFLAISWLLRKSFCSWLCPVGTLSEALWKLGRKLIGRSLQLPRWLDLPLRSLKYLLMSVFLFAVGMMSADAIEQFLAGPYGAVADVQMLNFFRHLSGTAAAVLIVLMMLSLFIQNFWCRYLCPYGALMGIAALFSPARIQRAPEPCIDCGKCNKACPSLLPVDQLVTIRSAECTGCLECVAVCPAEGALALKFPGRKPISPVAVAAIMAILFLGTVVGARVTGHWWPRMAERTTMELIGHADQAMHP